MQSEPRPATGTRWGITILVLMGIAWFAYLMLFGPEGETGDLATPRLRQKGQVLPTGFTWPLKDLDGQPVSFASFRGRPVFLNLWATWCEPCVREMPSIDNLAREPRLKDVAFLCIAVDERQAVREFVARQKPAATILLADEVPPVFQAEGIPVTFLIDPDGRIVAEHLGAARWDSPEMVHALEALAQPAPTVR